MSNLDRFHNLVLQHVRELVIAQPSLIGEGNRVTISLTVEVPPRLIVESSVISGISPEASINELELNVRAVNVMVKLGIKTLGQLTEKTEYDLIRLRGCGRKTLDVIKKELLRFNLHLAE